MTDRNENIEYNIDIAADEQREPKRWPVPAPNRWHATNSRGESVSMYRVGGEVYPMVTVRKCKTCTSPHRVQIENDILKSIPFVKIEQGLPEGERVPWRSINRHALRGHMPVEQQVIHEIAHKRAKDLGLDVINGGTALVDYITLGQTVVVKVYNKLVMGEVDPTLRDAVAFANILARAEEIAGADLDHEIIYRTFVEFQETVRRFTDAQTYQHIIDTIASSPVIRGLMERSERDGEIEDGEFEEDDDEGTV